MKYLVLLLFAFSCDMPYSSMPRSSNEYKTYRVVKDSLIFDSYLHKVKNEGIRARIYDSLDRTYQKNKK